MEQETRIARLEMLVAKMRATEDLMLISFCSLLAGELTPEGVAMRKERLIANALSTCAPDAAIEGYESAAKAILGALAHRNQRESCGTNPG